MMTPQCRKKLEEESGEGGTQQEQPPGDGGGEDAATAPTSPAMLTPGEEEEEEEEAMQRIVRDGGGEDNVSSADQHQLRRRGCSGAAQHHHQPHQQLQQEPSSCWDLPDGGDEDESRFHVAAAVSSARGGTAGRGGGGNVHHQQQQHDRPQHRRYLTNCDIHMREQDADLLESIYRSSANEDDSPGRATAAAAAGECSTCAAELLALENQSFASMHSRTAPAVADTSANSVASQSSYGGGGGWAAEYNYSVPGDRSLPPEDREGSIVDDGILEPPIRVRRALSGEVWSVAEPQQHVEDIMSGGGGVNDVNRSAYPSTSELSTVSAVAASSPDMGACIQQDTNYAAPAEFQFRREDDMINNDNDARTGVSCVTTTYGGDCGGGGSVVFATTPMSRQRSMVRTESMDRRLNEAAQFAEAVGEVVIICDENQRIIDDDDSGNDSSDDEDNVDEEEEGARDEMTESQLTAQNSSLHGGSALVGDAADTRVRAELEHQEPSVGALAPSSAHDLAATKIISEQEVTKRLERNARPHWPFNSRRGGGFFDKLGAPSMVSSSSLQQQEQNFVYKGIHSNPPEIVKRGITRGNYAQLHRKAWLEVSDKYHRYGKNLRLYYRYWESLGFPTNMFFDWLDSKGEAAGQPLPELAECPRSKLDADTVLYISNPDVTEGYALHFAVDEETGRAKVLDAFGQAVRTGTDGWIFVIRDNVLYGSEKVTTVTGHAKQRFHHSSFFGGKAVAAAGIFLSDEDGFLTHLYPHSGHYRPGEADMQRMLYFLYTEGVDLRTVEFDMQQILHVARENEKAEKLKKLESLCLAPAVMVACYLAHKARFIGEGIFSQIHWIKKAKVTSVREALELIDADGRGKASKQKPSQQ